MRYSHVTGKFYPPDAARLPSDAVDLTDAEFTALATGLLDGKSIALGDDGRPVVADPLVAVPSSVSPAQARLALLGAGLLDQVETLVANADPVTRIAWNAATTIERASPTVAALAAALGLTDEQLDELFVNGANIYV